MWRGSWQAAAVTDWLQVARRWGAERGAPEDVLEALSAFANSWPRGGPAGAPERTWGGSLEQLAAKLDAWGPPGSGWSDDALVALLAEEVDDGQAAMFGRRLRATDGLLVDLQGGPQDPAARLLRVFLRIRLEGITEAAPPRALRVRGLADYLYSRAGVLQHHVGGGPPLRALIEGVRWSPVAPGLAHATMDGTTRQGPLFVNLLAVDPRRVRLVAKHCRGDGALARSLPEVVAEEGAIAATSGGFFLYSEPDIVPPAARYQPVGLLMSEGRLVSAPSLARGALLVRDGRARIAVVGPPPGSVNRASADLGPDAPSLAVIDGRVVAVGRRLPVPLRGCVVPANLAPESATVGATFPWRIPATDAMAGGPVLLRDGVPTLDLRAEDFWGTAPPRTFSQDETGDTNLLPRLGVGQRSDGTLIFAACDGRDLNRALGWTLRGLGRLLAHLGCTDALNLDGGSSKRMVVRGRVVDLPSTEVRGGHRPATANVRPVQTAWLMFPE